MFIEAIAASDFVTVEHDGRSFTFSCMRRSIICMEVRRNGRAEWDNPGPMMPGQIPQTLTQPVLDKLNSELEKKYGENPGWEIDKKD